MILRRLIVNNLGTFHCLCRKLSNISLSSVINDLETFLCLCSQWFYFCVKSMICRRFVVFVENY